MLWYALSVKTTLSEPIKKLDGFELFDSYNINKRNAGLTFAQGPSF